MDRRKEIVEKGPAFDCIVRGPNGCFEAKVALVPSEERYPQVRLVIQAGTSEGAWSSG